MLDIRAIYHNQQIPPGYYYAKVIDLQTEPMEDYVLPKALVRLKIHPNHELGNNVILAAVIYPTERAKFLYINFLNTFLENHEVEIEKIMNRWGYIKVYPAKYGEAEYSAVQWIHQTPAAQYQVAKITADEKGYL